jgi:hypothetical protein
MGEISLNDTLHNYVSRRKDMQSLSVSNVARPARRQRCMQ